MAAVVIALAGALRRTLDRAQPQRHAHADLFSDTDAYERAFGLAESDGDALEPDPYLDSLLRTVGWRAHYAPDRHDGGLFERGRR